MSERMSAEKLRTHEMQTPQDVWYELQRARSEEARLMKDNAEKDEALRTLLVLMESYHKQAAHVGVVMLTPDGTRMLGAAIAMAKKALP